MNIDGYYSSVADKNLPPTLELIASGALPVPMVGVKAPADMYGFPPALIPLWSDDSGPLYVGIWNHLFVARRPVFVKCYIEMGFSVFEIARTWEQLIRVIALEAISNAEGVTAEIERFAAQTGLGDLDEIDAISRTSGDDPIGLIEHRAFLDDPPLNVVGSGKYRGEFPTPGASSLRFASSLELAPEALGEMLRQTSDAPRWFVTSEEGRQLRLFRSLLNAGHFGDAWLCLNSRGWLFSSVASALKELAAAKTDARLAALVAAWTALPQGEFGGY